jgi:hypothetical protein
MNSEELSIELEQHEQKMSSLQSQMDSLYNQIKGTMPAAAASWMKLHIEGKIKSNPEIVQSLGIEKLTKLKSNLKDLIDKLPVIVAAEFQDCTKWPHHIEVKESDYLIYKSEPHLNHIFRNVISNLGVLLNEVDLIKEPKSFVPSWERIGQNRFRYAINPSMPDIGDGEYNKLLVEYISLSIKLAQIRKKLSESKAKEMWDKA